MGKPTGFMDYERCDAASIEPKKRIKNFNEFMSSFLRKSSRSRRPDVWTAEFHFASQVVQ